MSEPTSPPARTSINNRIPAAAIWAFAIVMLAALLALPFLVFKVMATTQNQAQGMTLAGIAALPIPSRSLHCTVRETRDKGIVAARYELDADTARIIAARLKPEAGPDAALLAALQKLSPGETGWQPTPNSPGPWRSGAGFASGLSWRATLDKSVGVLWILAVRSDAK